MTNRVSDTVAAVLYAHGVRHAFGVPGGEVVTLIDGLQRAGVAFHLARHEAAAAIMAAGVSATTMMPGLLVTTIGPGLANAVNGIADAAQERTPLVVISGVVDRATRARFTHQVVDHKALLAPLVKASYEIEPESAGATVARALRLAMAEPRGPVHLDLSPTVAAAEDPSPSIDPPPIVWSPVFHPGDPAITTLDRRIAEARNPLILAGFEAARAGAGPELVAFAQRIGAPVMTTYRAKGIIPEDQPLSLGAAGLSPLADAVLLDLMRAADLLLFIGYDPIEMRIGWLDPVAEAGRIVEITAAIGDHAMHASGMRIAASPENVLPALATTSAARGTWPGGEPVRAKADLARRFCSPPGFGPHLIIDIVNAEAGEDALVTVDSGAHRILLSQKWVARRPLSLLQSAGFCTMAAALPLAIGAKLADPSRRVIAIMGDGGLEMGIGELATLRDLGLAVTIVLFQDESLALIALKQAAAGLAPAGVSLGRTDFKRIAEGFGGVGIEAASAADLRAALAEACVSPRFTLIACRFHVDAYQDAF